jgi:hypothetical protein
VEKEKEAITGMEKEKEAITGQEKETATTICRWICPCLAAPKAPKAPAAPPAPAAPKARKRVARHPRKTRNLPRKKAVEEEPMLLPVSVRWGLLILIRGNHIAHNQYLFLAMTSGGPPSPSEPATPSPTSANSIPIRATPYALFYDGDFTRIPNNDEFAAVADLTRLFLEEIMIDEFSQTSLTNLDDFLTFMIRNSFEFGEPVQGDYRGTGLFNPSSIFLPTVRELNSLIDDAFQDDSLGAYVKLLQNLPSGNIFRSTVGVMKGLPDVPVPRVTDGSTRGEGTFKMGLAAAAAGIVVLAAGAAMLKRQRGEEQLEDPYSENLKGDAATLAGETCTASLDGSSVWRKSSPYITDDLDESEFEDEPLDDDENETHSRPRGLAPPKAAFTS